MARLAGRVLASALALLAMAATPLHASLLRSTAERAEDTADPAYQALVNAANAVVGVRVKALPNARTNDTLGEDRIGSGVVIEPGLVLTIGYLVTEADKIEVEDAGGTLVPAVLLGSDNATGFAVLKPLANLTSRPIKLGSAKSVAALDRLMIVSGGDQQAVSIASVVSRRRFAGYWEYLIDDAIFTAPPRIDHSGAALIDRNGELVGIGSLFVLEATGPGESMPGNMFVPIDLLKPVLDDMIGAGGPRLAHHPWLGVNSLEEDGRVKVLQVNEESPADAAGIAAGDIILKVNGEAVASLENFYRKLWSGGAKPGDEYHLTVLHGPTMREVIVRSIDRDDFMRHKSGV